MDKDISHKLVLYVLQRTPVWLFNESIREFNVQRLYSRQKRNLMSDFPELMPSVLDYAIVMADAFRMYKCDEIECPKLRFKIDQIKSLLPTYKRYSPGNYREKVIEYNLLVEQYSVLLYPQNQLIKLYKKVTRNVKRSI